MTEFKQILGRGTRVHEDTHKYYFTLMDFRGATNHFADPDFDGEPVQIYEPDEDDPIVPPDDRRLRRSMRTEEVIDDEGNRRSARRHRRAGEDEPRKIYVNGVLVTIIAERVKYLDERRQARHREPAGLLEGAVTSRFASLDDLPQAVEEPDRKQAIIEELEEEGLRLDSSPTRSTPTSTRSTSSAMSLTGSRRSPAESGRRTSASATCSRSTAHRRGPSSTRCSQKYQDEGVVDLDDPRILQIPPLDSDGHSRGTDPSQFGGTSRLRGRRP